LPQIITDDLDALLEVLPPHIRGPLGQHPRKHELVEVILDLGRTPQGRFLTEELDLTDHEVAQNDIDYVVNRIGQFGGDNRAGIARTLHRISAMRNRSGKIIGLTCRVGRAVYGTVAIIRDLVETGQSVLILGRPGIGKTTILREVARVLADELKKRVIVVDTSNEIAGDGDIPHPSIGHARRMQVPTPDQQHAVMIEAVENHMPQAIIIDEIGTDLEAQAARTIAERGVQLVGTAHGNTLDNLMMNPTLSDLVGGIQSITLGDEEARRRGTQKSVLERKQPPTFGILVEIQDRWKVIVYPGVSDAVDSVLRGQAPQAESRWLDEEGNLQKAAVTPTLAGAASHPGTEHGPRSRGNGKESPRLYLFGVNRDLLDDAARERQVPLQIVPDLREANVLLTTRAYYRRKPQKVRDAEARGIPIYVLKNNAPLQMRQCLASLYTPEKSDGIQGAMREAEEAIGRIKQGTGQVELSPQASFIRRLQHLLAERNGIFSRSLGRDPERRVAVYASPDETAEAGEPREDD
jgi:stage III sporulation protein SpoIIIAA